MELPRFDHQERGTWFNMAEQPGAPLVPVIAPSILASDFGRLLEECRDVLSASGGACEWLHVDVMDGHFVPNISIGPCVIRALRDHLPHAFLDVHCMITEPGKWVKDMAAAGASQMTFHLEAAADDPAGTARLIREAGMQVGIAIKPGTPVNEALKALVQQGLIDMVLVMTVEPGFGGQSFMVDTMAKVRELRGLYPHLNIQVDGGLSSKTVETAASAGANVIVAGTSVFKAHSRRKEIRTLRSVVAKHLQSA